MSWPGSSPLARGLRDHQAEGRSVPRIIPARAGFTPAGRRRSPPKWDHPRSRGVYALIALSTRSASGSSPLARGLRRDHARRVHRRRIIPARAGFTRFVFWFCSYVWDHPRSRGVYSHGPSRRFAHVGSSPLARGLRHGVHRPQPGRRIIPARAGFTDYGAGPEPRRRDHPRSRGVYLRPTPGGLRMSGSSPLARGLRWALAG